MRIPLEEIRNLIIRIKHLMKVYSITESDIYDIEYWLKVEEWKFNQMKYLMNDEIKKYPIYLLNKNGQLVRIYSIKSTDDYNHFLLHLHHYIKHQDYEKNKNWYVENGIQQKLILLRIPIHEQLHSIAVKNLSDKTFANQFKIDRKELIYIRN